jgi:hypothetical protein
MFFHFKIGEHTMRNKLNKIALAAGFLLALAFTFSCFLATEEK